MKKWLDQYKTGGSANSLNRTVTCSNCGWSWRLSDGGKDPMTCHKCGGDIKMKQGGQLDEYQLRGQVQFTPTPTRAVSDNTRSQQFMPISDQQLFQNRMRFMPQPVQPQFTQGQRETPHSQQLYKERKAEELKRQVQRNSPFAQTMASFTPGNNIDAGVLGAKSTLNAAALMSAPALIPKGVGISSLSAPFTVGSKVIPWITPGSIIGAGFGLHGANKYANDLQSGYYASDDHWANKVSSGLITGLDMLGMPGAVEALGSHVVSPLYRGALKTGNYLTTQTPLRNAYKYNPWAFKPNPEALYRGIGEAGYKDAIESGLIRPNPKGNFQDLYTSPMFEFAETYGGYGKGKQHMVELPKILEKNAKDIRFGGSEVIFDKPISIDNAKFYKQDWLRGYKEVPKPTSVNSNVDNIINFSKYPSQLEAVQARAERLLSQKNKEGWNEQLTHELEEKLSTAVQRHDVAGDYPGTSLGANRSGRTETLVSKDANIEGVPLTDAQKAMIAAHETGHYYSNSLKEGTDWQKYFDFSDLPYRTSKYLKGKSNYLNFGNEIRERAAQLKDFIAFKNKIPLNQDFKITRTQLDDALENYVKETGLDNTMTPFIQALKKKGNISGFLKEMNKRPLVLAPAGIVGAAALQQEKNGGAIITNRGQWDYPGQTTIIPSNQITMQGVDYPVLGVDNTGHQIMMQPGGNYTFPGEYVTEYPMMQGGGLVKYQLAGQTKSANPFFPNVKPETNRVFYREPFGNADDLTNLDRRERISLSRNLDSAYVQLAKITPDYKSQADREMLFRRHRPVNYPGPFTAMYDVAIDYIDKMSNIPWNPARVYTKNIKPKAPFLDKEGDYNAAEEAWRMTLGLPVKNKYIVPSSYRPINETNKNSRYFTLNRDIIDPDAIRERIKELKLKPEQSVVEESFAPYIKDSYMPRKEFSQIDPLQQFKIGINKKGKPYIYDKYDFNFEPLSKVTRPYEYEFYEEFKGGGEMIKRADGSYSRRGLWDNIRANRGSGKKPTKQMLEQERKIRNKKQKGGEEYTYWRTGEPMVNDPSMDAISKVLLQRNLDKNFMQRAAGFGYQGGIPTKYIPGEDPNSDDMSSLLMGTGGNRVFPTIIQTGPQQLSFQPDQREEYLEAPSWDVADYFATKGYKRAANDMYGMEYGNGGYVVRRSNDRKGKTHVVIGPDGTKKYFGDPNMGERSKSKYGKEAFYARHKKNIAKNPYFKAYAKATWKEGGQIMKAQVGLNVGKDSKIKGVVDEDYTTPQLAVYDNSGNLVEQKELKQETGRPYYMDYIYRNPKTEFPCEGKGCAQIVSNELTAMGLNPVRSDAWFMNDAVKKAGGKEIWRKGQELDYSKFRIGDIVSLDRPGRHHQREMRENNPGNLIPERDVEHVGTIVGFTPEGVPLVKHGGADENTVVQPITNPSLKVLSLGHKLNYQPYSVYRVPGSDKFTPYEEYANRNYRDIKEEMSSVEPLHFRNAHVKTTKKQRFVDALNRNLELQSRNLNLSPDETQQLQKIAFGIFGNESEFGQSSGLQMKEFLKRLGYGFGMTDTSPSLGDTRVKYDDLSVDGKTKIGRAFNRLGVNRDKLVGPKASRNYDDEVNATIAVLANTFNKLKAKDENGRYIYNFNPATNTVFNGVPIGMAVAKLYNAPAQIKKYNKENKYSKNTYFNVGTHFDDFPLFPINLPEQKVKGNPDVRPSFISESDYKSKTPVPRNATSFMDFAYQPTTAFRIGGQSTLNPITRKDGRNWLDFLKN